MPSRTKSNLVSISIDIAFVKSCTRMTLARDDLRLFRILSSCIAVSVRRTVMYVDVVIVCIIAYCDCRIIGKFSMDTPQISFSD